MAQKTFFIRNAYASSFMEIFLVSAVVTILGIRLYLYVNNFPQVGGNGLHIAHMLWGGLAMLIAIVLLLVFVDRTTRWITSLMAGIGFGFFIDELGKFLTSDNNYFFQPAISIMYIVFVALYLVFRGLEHRALTHRDYLVNGIEYIKEAVLRDLDVRDIDHARQYLSRCRPEDPVVKTLRHMLQALETTGNDKRTTYQRFRMRLYRWYLALVKKGWFGIAVITFYLFGAVLTLALASIIVWLFKGHAVDTSTLDKHTRSFDQIAPLIFSSISAVITLAGVLVVLKHRMLGYQLIRAAILISLFLTQIFEFYDIQFGALIGLTINILGLSIINTMISLERARTHREEEQTAHKPSLPGEVPA